MSTEFLSVFMDFAVLAALGGTIYYTLRLSNSLRNFKSQRNEMKNLIVELSKNIDEAQDAIHGLRTTSNKASHNLEDAMHDARIMADELKTIMQSGDKLATRLAKDISKKRSGGFDEEYFDEPEAANEPANIEAPSFFIQDREFDDEGDGELKSQAEKDLYDAIQRNKKQGA